MLTIKDYRSKNTGMIRASSDRVEISFVDLKEKVIAKLRKAQIEKNLSNEDFKRMAYQIIDEYVYDARPFCEGYVQEGVLLSETLIKDIYNSITSWGILTPFIEQDSYRELQINGPNIFVDTKEGYRLFRGSDNKIIKFTNADDALNFIKSTLNFSGERMTEESPLVNALTLEGFRVSATSPSIYPAHPSEPTVKWPTATYRKVGGSTITHEEFVRYGTAAEEMLLFIKLSFKSMIGMIFVGTTGCGKTTLMEYGLVNVPDNEKVICIQSPSEYNYRKMVDGTMQNNAMYWEVDSRANPNNPASATQDNLVSHTLRNDASLVVMGECRDKDDIGAFARAQNAGTRVVTSLHSFSIVGTVDRFALELVSKLGVDMDVARDLACTYITTITLCDRLGDRSRKIMGQAEVVGYDRKTKEYIINYLYEFVLVASVPREGIEGEAGLIWNIGFFVKRANPTNFFIRNMIKTGVSLEEIDLLKSKPIGSVIKEVHFEKLPKDFVVKYDHDIIPMEDTQTKYAHLSPEDSVGIAI